MRVFLWDPKKLQTLTLLVSLLLFCRQKQVITRLRQEHLQMEEKLHGAIIATKSHGIEEEKSDFRVKELMYQISELKAKRAEDKVMKQQEIEKLQAKLGYV